MEELQSYNPGTQSFQDASKPFIFVEETGIAIQAKPAATRTRIRSQARLNIKKAKIVPVISNKSRRLYPKLRPDSQDEDSNHELELTPLSILPSLQGYERTRIGFNFDILNLSGLTSIHMGEGSSLSVLDPRIEQWVRLEGISSYLDFVPAYYESSPLVRLAVDCTLAQYKSSLHLGNAAGEMNALLLYDRALRALQDALSDPQKCLSGETMLATAILQLYELLNPSAKNRWTMHFRGLMKLIEMRGPELCGSSLERRIFTTHFGPIIAECFNHQLSCFLEQPGWDDVLVSMAQGNSQVVDLLNAMHMCSAFARRARDYMLGSERSSHNVNKILLEGLAIKDLTPWYRRYKATQGRGEEIIEANNSTSPESGLVTWGESNNEMLCSTWAIHIVINRLLVALRPLADNARSLEAETQAFASALLELQARPWIMVKGTSGHQTGLTALHTHTAIDAKLAIETREEWQRVISGEENALDPSRETVTLDIYERWNRGLASKEPTLGPVMFS